MSDTPRESGFCAHAVHEAEMLLVPDATKDARFADNPFVAGDFHLRFYAGVPLRERAGKGVGSFCLVDPKPRELSARQLGQLKQFAAIVQAELQR